ncbi:competence/damage-inducible protein A [Helicovermis profundi]|uniref:Putative competence-damage inducible protein n=1 Tax=Helicovermis profundi TaxID=3065157 RepID=A0AAU9E3T7_9FIRM|nr:competence/damage-inducible protein A [Clostridia bacterium S502]
MKAAILTIGTELLMGMTLNTNSEYLSRKLNELGISVMYHSTVGDNEDRIIEDINRLYEKVDLIVTSGGLGPTKDDITKEVIANALGLDLVLNEEVKLGLIERFKKYGRNITENNFRQAYFPKDSIILDNDFGTAPGCIVKKGKKMALLLPGPPREVNPMFENYASKELQKMNKNIITSKFIKVFGMGESKVEDKIMDIVENQSNPTIATYVKSGEVLIRVTSSSENEEENYKLINPIVDEITSRIGEYIFNYEDMSLPETTINLLLEKKFTISTAESCTGGLIAKLITDFSGVSDIYKCSLITYANEAKVKELNVSEQSLDEFGAVSEEVCLEMLDGLYEKTKSDICITVTGIAGPNGGSEEKPVGLVYIGIKYFDNTFIFKKNFRGGRERIRMNTALFAFNEIRKIVTT